MISPAAPATEREDGQRNTCYTITAVLLVNQGGAPKGGPVAREKREE